MTRGDIAGRATRRYFGYRLRCRTIFLAWALRVGETSGGRIALRAMKCELRTGAAAARRGRRGVVRRGRRWPSSSRRLAAELVAELGAATRSDATQGSILSTRRRRSAGRISRLKPFRKLIPIRPSMMSSCPRSNTLTSTSLAVEPERGERCDLQRVARFLADRRMHLRSPKRVARAVPDEIEHVGVDRGHQRARIDEHPELRCCSRASDRRLDDDQLTRGVVRLVSQLPRPRETVGLEP